MMTDDCTALVASYRHGCDPPGYERLCIANPARVSPNSVSPAPVLLNSQHNSTSFNDIVPSNNFQTQLQAGLDRIIFVSN